MEPLRRPEHTTPSTYLPSLVFAVISKSLESIELSKNYIMNGRGSLYNKAEKMKELGANVKSKLSVKE